MTKDHHIKQGEEILRQVKFRKYEDLEESIYGVMCALSVIGFIVFLFTR